MENVESSLNSPEKRTQLISQLRDSCEQLLVKYGKVEKVSKITTSFQKLGKLLGLRHVPVEATSKKLEDELEINREKEKVVIMSTSENPTISEFIKISGAKHMNELFLSKENAFILENSGMGENMSTKETVVESPSFGESGVERAYSNPKEATKEEIEPYKLIIDSILVSHHI